MPLKFIQEQRQHLDDDVPHLFAENKAAGERNGHKIGQFAQQKGSSIVRVASRDSTAAASYQSYDKYGQLRRVIHLVTDCPVMLISNIRTSAGLVNGSLGTIKAIVLREGTQADAASDEDVRHAIPASSVLYVLVEFPKYTGPAVYTANPKLVPIQPLQIRHKHRRAAWARCQLPLASAYGITIHKSQGLTFKEGCVVDFTHQPQYQPASQPGLAFVGMSRCTAWNNQGFRNLPSFWDFRKVLHDPIYLWRRQFENNMDEKHDATIAAFLGENLTVEADIEQHLLWTTDKQGHEVTTDQIEETWCKLMRY
jgi:hypothetical protein